MENNQNDSYARRSKKYKDNSNFDGYQAEPIDSETPEDSRSFEMSRPTRTQHSKKADIPEMYEPDDLIEYDEFGHKRSAQRTSSANRAKAKRRKREAIGWILSICLAVAAALLIRAFIFEIILVDGESMYPTLYTNERVAIEKLTRYGRMPERGEIIIVEYPNLAGTYVKRAIGLPGETVEIKNSIVYIDGVPLDEPYVNPDPYSDMPPTVVPDEHVFVMGDNRAHSLDSRTERIGPIAHDAIIGHGLFVIWPLNNIHSIS